ncbi:MAG: cyclic nucleotide-binding domain-containing protein [Pseudomonadales bacterium]|jgi:CRP-like cAMP-binding protein|nr:cyclic nucleotide-binding domain-containing protein [Pseudomonadales bacterium]
MTDTLLDRLARHPVLADLDTEALGALATATTVREVPADTVLAREGENADRFFLLEAGHLAIETRDRASAPVLLQTLAPGAGAGWSWLLGDPWKFDVRAVDDVTVLEIDAAAVRAELERDPAFARLLLERVLRMVTERLEATRLRLLDVYGP